MRTKQLESIIEAILFTMGDSVEVSKDRIRDRAGCADDGETYP